MKFGKKKGLTLIEVIIVIAILGILASVLLRGALGQKDSSKADTNRIEATNILQSCQAYIARTEEPVPSCADLTALTALNGFSGFSTSPILVGSGFSCTLTTDAHGVKTTELKFADDPKTDGIDESLSGIYMTTSKATFYKLTDATHASIGSGKLFQ